MIWSVGQHGRGSVPAPGEANHFWRIVGVAHGCIAVSDVEMSMTHVWDEDGLWVGRFFDNPDLKAAPLEAYELCGESFGGSLYEDPKTGEVLFYGGGINNSPVYRISGWDQFERQRGQLALSPDLAAKITAKAHFEDTRADVARIGSVKDAKIDGDLAECRTLKAIEIKDANEVPRQAVDCDRGQFALHGLGREHGNAVEKRVNEATRLSGRRFGFHEPWAVGTTTHDRGAAR